MSTTFLFGEWLPDLPATGLQGATTATNVTPGSNSYLPFPSLVDFSLNSIPGRAQGGIIAKDNNDTGYNFIGNESAIYSLIQTSFTDVTRLVGGGYTVDSGEFWEFAQWNNVLYGVNGFTDPTQQISLGTANFTDLSIGIKARHIAVMRDFLVFGNISDSAANIYRIRWSAINNPTSWTVDAATLADFQDLPAEGGAIQRVFGGEYGIVFQKRSIWRMQFVGSPLVFQFDRVHTSIGAFAPQACIRYQNLVFFLSDEGFYSFDGSTLDGIGKGKVDKFFFDDLSVNDFQRINAVIDPNNQLVIWAYPSSNSIGGNPDKLLVFSWAYKRWTLVEGLNIQYFLQSMSIQYTLEGLDAISTNLDTGISLSLDSPMWTGRKLILAAFNATGTLAQFNGSAMAVTLDTGEFQLFPDRRALLTEIRPNIIGKSVSATITVLNRNNLTESVSIGAVATYPNTTGFCQTRVGARYFRIRLQTSSNTNFLHATGVEVEGVPEGKR